jgi:hypothetical protein
MESVRFPWIFSLRGLECYVFGGQQASLRRSLFVGQGLVLSNLCTALLRGFH